MNNIIDEKYLTSLANHREGGFLFTPKNLNRILKMYIDKKVWYVYYVLQQLIQKIQTMRSSFTEVLYE